MADLSKLLRKLNINGGKLSNDNAFLDELEATDSLFSNLSTTSGIFHGMRLVITRPWAASNQMMKSFFTSTIGEPNRLKPIRQIETLKRFQSSHLSASHKNKFPYGEADIACIHVAVKVSVHVHHQPALAWSNKTKNSTTSLTIIISAE